MPTTYRVSPVRPVSAADVRGWWIPDAAFTALRVFLAAMLVRHGLQDHLGAFLPAGERWLGAPAPLTDRWLAATLQLGAGFLLAVGLYARTAAFALLAVVLLGHFASGPAAGHWVVAGREPIVLYAGVLGAFLLTGPGLISLDTLRVSRHRRGRRAPATVRMSSWLERQYRRRELMR